MGIEAWSCVCTSGAHHVALNSGGRGGPRAQAHGVEVAVSAVDEPTVALVDHVRQASVLALLCMIKDNMYDMSAHIRSNIQAC